MPKTKQLQPRDIARVVRNESDAWDVKLVADGSTAERAMTMECNNCHHPIRDGQEVSRFTHTLMSRDTDTRHARSTGRREIVIHKDCRTTPEAIAELAATVKLALDTAGIPVEKCFDCDGMGKYPAGHTCKSCGGVGHVLIGSNS